MSCTVLHTCSKCGGLVPPEAALSIHGKPCLCPPEQTTAVGSAAGLIEEDFSQFFHAYESRETDGVITWQSETAHCGYRPVPGVARNPKPPDNRCCPICLALFNYPPSSQA